MSYLLPVYGRHVQFPTYLEVGPFRTSPVVLPDHGIMGIAVGISLLLRMETEIYVMSYLLAAILDLQRTQTLNSIQKCSSVFPHPENEVYSLEFRCYQSYELIYLQLHSFSRQLGFLTSGFIWQCY